jgi:YbbR domain-containing protein
MISFLRKLVFVDFWLKLFSLGLAILIWLTVWFSISKDVSPFAALTNRSTEKTYFNVPILVILPASDVRNVKVDPGTVQVTVRAEPKLLDDLKMKDIRAQVDLTGIESARGLHQRIDITLPTGVIEVRTIPSEVEVIVPPKS